MDNGVTSSAIGASRRRVLQALGLGAAIGTVALPSAGQARPAAAPLAPTDADVELLGFATSVELAAVAAYDTALASGMSLDEHTLAALTVFREHHEAYAASLSGLLGTNAPTVANAAVLAEYAEAFGSGSADTTLDAALELENRAAATHVSLLGQLAGLDGARLVASIAPIEARHATALATLRGVSSVAPETGIEPLDAAMTPADYPLA